jgi:6-phosphofructokinase 1
MAKSLAILTSGGDSAGMNPAVKCAAEYASQKGYDTHLIYDGLRGLIADNIVPTTREQISGILHRGGTMLRSARSTSFTATSASPLRASPPPSTTTSLAPNTASASTPRST